MSSTPLAPRQVAALLDSTVTTLRVELAALPEPLLTFHPGPGEWCAKEVVGHLVEAERRGFAGRIRIILAGDTPPLESWDPAEVARARRDCARDAAGLVDELARLRKDSVSLVSALRDADLARAGLHPKVGFLPVAGNAQGFSRA
jgi:hypothetical protein